MAGLPITNWIRFFVWLLIGLCVFTISTAAGTANSPTANLQAAAVKGKMP